MTTHAGSAYPLGNTQAEHERLARQSQMLASATERLFRSAGISEGQRVLDLGSGAGDVAMLVARIVGEQGEVLGIERNGESLAWARERVRNEGLRNVRFVQADVSQVPANAQFDALVGRFILMFVPDPVAVLRSGVRLVKRGGAVAFLEPSWKSTITLAEHAPLWFAGKTILRATLLRSGAEPEMGFKLHGVFQEAGLPAPDMEMSTLIGSTPDRTRWLADTLRSMRPQGEALGVSFDAVGDLETLTQRVQAEIDAAKLPVPILSVVAASARIGGGI